MSRDDLVACLSVYPRGTVSKQRRTPLVRPARKDNGLAERHVEDGEAQLRRRLWHDDARDADEQQLLQRLHIRPEEEGRLVGAAAAQQPPISGDGSEEPCVIRVHPSRAWVDGAHLVQQADRTCVDTS